MTPNEPAPDERDLACAREAFGTFWHGIKHFDPECVTDRYAILSARLSREREAGRGEAAPVTDLSALRDQFAAAALTGLIAQTSDWKAESGVAKAAYTVADAMIAARAAAALTRGVELHAEGKVK